MKRLCSIDIFMNGNISQNMNYKVLKFLDTTVFDAFNSETFCCNPCSAVQWFHVSNDVYGWRP